MKKILLQKITQFNTVYYIGRIDPRILCKVAKELEMSTTQEAQRPLSEKRVKEIACYVENYGILPNTLTLATNNNMLKVNKIEGIEGVDDLYYLDFPNTEEELNAYKNTIDVMDGQHRLYSFHDTIRCLADNIKYQIGFTLFITPTLQERRKIFVTCNEKQEKVSGNLLMWFRSKLDMLSEYEKIYYSLVSKLNTCHPLKGKIIMSAEKIFRGFKAKEVMEALKNAHIDDLCVANQPLSEDKKVKVISTYLSAWENVVGFSFIGSDAKTAGAAIKMAGLRYMLLLLIPMWDKAINHHKLFNTEFIESTIKELISSYGVLYKDFFLANKTWFRDRTAIADAANGSAMKIRTFGSESFNPLGE